MKEATPYILFSETRKHNSYLIPFSLLLHLILLLSEFWIFPSPTSSLGIFRDPITLPISKEKQVTIKTASTLSSYPTDKIA